MKLSACTLDCTGTCSFIVDAKDGKPGLRGNPNHPFCKGLICAKGKGLLRRINHPDRITEPLLKRNGSFEPISWEEALTICADKINQLHPEEILHIKGYGYRGVLAKASSFFFQKLGTLQTYGSLCDNAGCEAIIRNFGSLDQNNYTDIENSDVIINWGRDISRSSIHITQIIKRKRAAGTQVISISPGGDGNEKYSDTTICISPGTDRFLAAAIINNLIEDNAVDKEAVSASNGYQNLKSILMSYGADALSEICGVSSDNIRKLTNVYKSDKNISSLIGWGVQRYIYGGENVRFITALCALSGKLGKEGCGFYYNISSGRNFRSWAAAPETPQDKKVLLQKFESEINKREHKVKFMWIDGINIANQVPDCRSAARALEECDFVVTVDAFMNDTASRSDLILPCALTMEREDILGSAAHNCIAWSGKIFEPRGKAKSDFDILRELAELVFEDNPIPDATTCLNTAIDTPTIPVSYSELKEKGFAETIWPQIAYEGYRFAHKDSKMILPHELNNEPLNETGFNLLTLVRKNHLHSQIAEEQQTGITELFISPSSAYLGDIQEGEKAQLNTKLGSLEVVIKFDMTIHPEAAIIRRGGWMKFNRNANTIIESKMTDMGNGTAYYSQKALLSK